MKLNKLMILSACIVLLSASCSKNDPEKGNEAKEERSKIEIVKLSRQSVADIKLETAEASEGELTGEITVPAKIQVNQDCEASVGSLVQGRISRVFVKLGDHVRKGQPLVVLEGLQIGEIKAQYLKAQANLAFAESNYKRLKSLIDQNVGSQKSVLEAKAEYDKARAEFNAEDKKIHSIGLTDQEVTGSGDKIEHTSGNFTVKSPIDGVVIERTAVIGQLVELNTNLFKILNPSSLLADGEIYETDLNRIVGKPDVTITNSAFRDVLFHGKVTYISEVMDKETRTIKVRATVTNTNKLLKPEMFAEMHIPAGRSANALLVPGEAIIRDGKENYVFVALSDTTFEKRDVQPGNTMNGLVEVRNGLKKGERVVTKGSFMLKSEYKKNTFADED